MGKPVFAGVAGYLHVVVTLEHALTRKTAQNYTLINFGIKKKRYIRDVTI